MRQMGIDYIRFGELRRQKFSSQGNLAEAAGVSQQLIGQIERGEVESSKKLGQIARALGVDPGELDEQFVSAAEIIPRRALLPEVGRAKMPIYAAAEGGPGEIIITTDAIEYSAWPQPLEHIKEGYGILLTGESMVPAYRAGDTALVNPKLPPMAGEEHIFYAQDPMSGNALATIKTLRRSRPDAWEVEQFNPAREFELPRTAWSICHRVVGKYNRR